MKRDNGLEVRGITLTLTPEVWAWLDGQAVEMQAELSMALSQDAVVSLFLETAASYTMRREVLDPVMVAHVAAACEGQD